MPDIHQYPLASNPRSVSLVMFPALLLSAMLHVTAGSLLLHMWQRAPAVALQPLTVTLAATASAQPAIDIPQSQPKRNPIKISASRNVTSAVSLSYVSAPSLGAVEHVEAALFVATTPPQTSAASVLAVPASAAVSAPSIADAIEPPHFKIAYLNNPPPAYPPLARKLGLEGRVVLRVRVVAEGAPEQVTVAQTSGTSLLDEAALKAVQSWTFKPPRRGDIPVAGVVDVPIRFRLEN